MVYRGCYSVEVAEAVWRSASGLAGSSRSETGQSESNDGVSGLAVIDSGESCYCVSAGGRIERQQVWLFFLSLQYFVQFP